MLFISLAAVVVAILVMIIIATDVSEGVND